MLNPSSEPDDKNTLPSKSDSTMFNEIEVLTNAPVCRTESGFQFMSVSSRHGYIMLILKDPPVNTFLKIYFRNFKILTPEMDSPGQKTILRLHFLGVYLDSNTLKIAFENWTFRQKLTNLPKFWRKYCFFLVENSSYQVFEASLM